MELETIIKLTKCFLSDKYIFPLFEGLFFFFFLFAALKDVIARQIRKKPGVSFTLMRGEESMNWFFVAYGLTSVIIIQIINSAETFGGYKTLISLLNLAMLCYLSFFNNWFRNKIVGTIAV